MGVDLLILSMPGLAFNARVTALMDRYHIVAPDLPGFGYTESPDRREFKYTFEHLADMVDGFAETLGIERYAIYVFDYGARVGFRLALRHPERVTAVVSQNGNAYLESLSEGWNPIQAYWKDPSPQNRTRQSPPKSFRSSASRTTGVDCGSQRR